MAIDTQKVLLIRNSNVAVAELSASVSDWYAGARGLCGTGGSADYFWLSYDFGNGAYVDTAGGRAANPSHTGPILDSATTPVACTGQSTKITSNQVGQTLVSSIRSVVLTYGINAILVLPGVPRSIYIGGAVQTGGEYEQFIELILAYIHTYASSSIPTLNPLKTSADNLGMLITDGTGSGISRTGRRKPLTSIPTLCEYYSIPAGRVGWVDRNVPADNCSSLAEVQAIVNNAKAAELVNNFSKLHVLGGSAYIAPGGVLSSTAVNYLGRDAGLTNLSYIDYIPPTPAPQGFGYAEDELWVTKPPWAGAAQAEWNTGTPPGTQSGSIQAYGGGKITPFCVVSPRVEPYVTVSYQTDRLAFQPGGFGYGWTSSADLLSQFILKTGGSMGFGSGGEPWSNNLDDSDALLYLLLLGCTGVEACNKAGSAFKYTGPSVRDMPSGYTYSGPAIWTSVQGDPLYRPYKFNPLNAGKIMQVGQ
jgi:hypothetical protein